MKYSQSGVRPATAVWFAAVGRRCACRRQCRAHVVGTWGVATCLLALLAGCQQPMELEVAGMLDRAQRTFDQAESKEAFLLAASQYQAVLDRGVVSGAVLFNQGNAYMRAGERGRAIVSYRQAKRYRPRDPYLDANLRVALGGDDPADERRLVNVLFFWQDWISYPEKFQGTVAVAVVCFLFGVIALLWRQRWCGHVAIGLLIMTMLMAVSAGYDWYRYESVVHGVVIDEEVVARKGNATSYEPAFTAPLGEGTEFRVLEQRGTWMLIRLEAGQEGWIAMSGAQLY